MLDDELKSILHRYRKFVKDVREKYYKQFDKIMSYKEFFDKGEKVEWYASLPEGKVYHNDHPCYSNEVFALVEFAQSKDFTDFENGKTIENFGLRIGLDLYKEKEDSCCYLALRVMLTSIVIKELFCDGLIASAMEMGTISAILNS